MPPKLGGITSKFRNLDGTASKTKYSDLKVSVKSTETWALGASSSLISFIIDSSGGGVVGILDVNDQIRQPPHLSIAGHTAAIQDVKFSPFHDDLLATSCDAGVVNVWKIPEKNAWAKKLKTPIASFSGHTKRVYSVEWNPVADGILCSGSCDNGLCVWTTQRDAASYSIPHQDYVYDISWKEDGRLLATTCRDKKLRIVDPRSSSVAAEAVAYAGAKHAKVCWADGTAGDENRIVTTGFGNMGVRQLSIWDSRRMQAPVTQTDVDRQSSFLLLYWDESGGILYITGKGETTIKPHVFSDAGILTAVKDFKGPFAHRAVCFAPKRSVDVSKSEIQRAYIADTSSIVPISFTVPRKKTDVFADDLYPPCLGDTATMTSDQWLGGATGKPSRLSLDPSKGKRSITGAITPGDGKNAGTAPSSKPELPKTISKAEPTKAGPAPPKTEPAKTPPKTEPAKTDTAKTPLKAAATKTDIAKRPTLSRDFSSGSAKGSFELRRSDSWMKSPDTALKSQKTAEKPMPRSDSWMKSPDTALKSQKTAQKPMPLEPKPLESPRIFTTPPQPKVDAKPVKLVKLEEKAIPTALNFNDLNSHLSKAKDLMGELKKVITQAETSLENARQEQERLKKTADDLKAKLGRV